MRYKKAYLICFALMTMLLAFVGCSRSKQSVFHIHRCTPQAVTPSCTEMGYTYYECACGYNYTENSIGALGHRYKMSVADPTADSEGYVLYACSRCGDSYREDFVVYADAQKDYLLPLEVFCREQKQAQAFVMLHFSSAVMQSEEDPYNIDTIRSIFEDYEVSTHYIIERDGTVRCYVPENLVAYHAGFGTWGNDPKYTDQMNDYAIGIELVAIGSQNDMELYFTAAEYSRLDQSLVGYTDAQYEALKELVKDICQRYDIPMDSAHVIGHQAYSPQKTDPGELFDWERLFL